MARPHLPPNRSIYTKHLERPTNNRGYDKAEYRLYPEHYRPTFHETVRA